jgi:signal transduction histidine kinase
MHVNGNWALYPIPALSTMGGKMLNTIQPETTAFPRQPKSDLEMRHRSAELLSAQEAERKRIANELHDSIGLQVSNLRFGIARTLSMIREGNSPGAEEMLNTLDAHAKLAVDEVRRIAMDLRPAMLDDLGLVRTLSWFFRELSRVHPDLDIKTEITIDESDVTDRQSIAIFRVVQEGCSNAIRHSGTSEIQVALIRLDGVLHLRIEDKGGGFVVADDGSIAGCGGHGLRNMQDRVESTGGVHCLFSEVGVGTCIVANWPLSRAHRANSAGYNA